jgi:isoleucyl-tRNA synthetase
VSGLDPQRAAAALREGRTVAINVDGADHELSGDDLLVALAPLEGYQLEREGSHAVALELALDEALRREGLAQEIVHAIQNARKATGLAVEDRIALTLAGDADLIEVARAFEAHVAGETLAVEVAYDGEGAGEPARIEGRELRIGVARSA